MDFLRGKWSDRERALQIRDVKTDAIGAKGISHLPFVGYVLGLQVTNIHGYVPASDHSDYSEKRSWFNEDRLCAMY